jgi:hypothetical protein
MDSVVSWMVITCIASGAAIKFFFAALAEKERNRDL